MKILIIILSLVSSFAVNAQYTLTDDDGNSISDGEVITVNYDSTVDSPEAEFDCHVSSTNSNDFLFEIVSTNQGGTAENWFCTNFGLCYPSSVTEVQVNLLSDNTRELQLHYRPNGYTDDVTINYRITEVNNTSNTVSFSVKFVATTTGISSNPISTMEVNMFPNPANDYTYVDCNLNENYQVRIYNITGMLVAKYQVNKGQKSVKINTSILNSGKYILQIISESNNSTNQNLIVIH